MGLTLNQETSDRVSEAVLPPRMGGSEACHCGSGSKYKRCCGERDEALRRQLRGSGLPEWIDGSRSKLHQFEKYICNVFGLPDLLASFIDTRRAPKIPTFDVVNSLFHTAVLRIPSINALEGDLQESDFQKLIGRQPTPEVKAFSADVVANVLDKLELQGIRKANEEVISKAERNKAFRDGSYGALRCVAIDGWEPFSSYDRHCPNCLVRKVKVKRRTGGLEEVEQYYHHYVVALLLGPVLDVVLGIEPVRNEEARRDRDPEHVGHEGELTAARRLIDSLHDTYGGFIDALVLDALYANGPVMTQLTAHGYPWCSRRRRTSRSKTHSPSGRWRNGARATRIGGGKSMWNFGMWMILRRSAATKGKFARSARWSPSRAKIPRPGASPSSGSARASSVAERRYRSSVRAGTSKTPRFINGSNIGTSRTCSGIRKMRSCLSYFFGRSLLICFSCSSIGGWVVAADRRIRLTRSGTSSRSCFAKWPLSPSPFLGRLFSSIAADTAPEPR